MSDSVDGRALCWRERDGIARVSAGRACDAHADRKPSAVSRAHRALVFHTIGRLHVVFFILKCRRDRLDSRGQTVSALHHVGPFVRFLVCIVDARRARSHGFAARDIPQFLLATEKDPDGGSLMSPSLSLQLSLAFSVDKR